MTDETKLIGDKETAVAELVRLPLWKSCVEDMLASGVTYGATYPAEYFEKKLRCERSEMKFGIAVSEIRRALEIHGFYLSGRGLKGDSFIVLEPSSNQDIMKSYSSAAIDALKRGVILGTNTRLDTLSAEERRRHESILEKMATRLMMLKHSKSIQKLLTKKPQEVLEDDNTL